MTIPPFPLMWCDHKSQGLWSLGLGIHWWRQSCLQWTWPVNNYVSILTRVAQGQLAVHCLRRLIGVYGLLTKSWVENILTVHSSGQMLLCGKDWLRDCLYSATVVNVTFKICFTKSTVTMHHCWSCSLFVIVTCLKWFLFFYKLGQQSKPLMFRGKTER